MSTFKINLHEAIHSLSNALDLVGITHIRHGKRVAFMAAECARHLGWPKHRIDDLFESSILHDIGVARTVIHSRLTQFEWENESDHCDIGASLLLTSPLLEKFAPIVRHHHTHWSVLKDMELAMEVKLAANCIYMVDRVDVLSLAFSIDQSNLLLGKEMIRGKIMERRGAWFCPELVDAFMEISSTEAFWFSIESEQVDGYAKTWLSETTIQEMEFQELRSIVLIFSFVVDAKSPYTKAHSEGVARLGRLLGSLLGLQEDRCEMIELAGLLHDIGKLRVPDELLDKAGQLTGEEYSLLQRHSFDTYNILKDIKGLEKIAEWASQHHEHVDGTGYPFHLGIANLSLEARIVSAADVFQALAQKRPYRDSLGMDNIMQVMNEQAATGKLDRDVVKCINDNLQDCWNAAVSAQQP
jgi:HD-GYP domain-containing protein (c-di-GMP phosphodiesterase class II)